LSRVLLTGATGFIGRHTLIALSNAGHEVHVAARQRGPQRAGVTWHQADLLAGCGVVGEVAPEILVHLAWYAEHGRFWTSPENLRWVAASLELLRPFADAGGQRVVMAGTCAEYEWSRAVYREDSPLGPSTLYGAAKRGLHTVAAAYCEQMRIELAWGRLFFLYGPYEAPERFVPSLVRALLAGEAAPMTSGTQRRDFLHVADAGAAFAALASSSLVGAVNIASGEGVALRDLAALIAERSGDPELLRVGALPDRDGDPASLVADVSRMRGELGFSPQIDLADGLDAAVGFWRERSRP
jgi:nucleoside-diphosphate-sugar epimerase